MFVERFFTKHILSSVEYCFKSLSMKICQITKENIFSFQADPLAIHENYSKFIRIELSEEMIVSGISTQGFERE